MMGEGEPQGPHEEAHWRARRLRKRIEKRRRREKGESLVVRHDDERRQARDAASLRALQVGRIQDKKYARNYERRPQQ